VSCTLIVLTIMHASLSCRANAGLFVCLNRKPVQATVHLKCTHCMSDKPVDSLPVACHGFFAHPRQYSDPQHQARLHRLCKATKGLSLRLRDFTRPSLQLLNNHVAAHGLQKYPAHTVPSAGPLTAKGGGPWSWRQAPCPSCHCSGARFCSYCSVLGEGLCTPAREDKAPYTVRW